MMIGFTVSPMFSNHMVLRHSRLNPVWGRAPFGAEITLHLAGYRAHCLADEGGHWFVSLMAPPPGFVGTMEITCQESKSCQKQKIVFEDVAAGEVWLAAGQSNMEMPLMCAKGGALEVQNLATPNIRIKTISRRCNKSPQYGWHFYPADGSEKGWEHLNKENAPLFSAIGYFFGKGLAQSLKIPVGIINCNWGGTKIQSWLPTQELLRGEDTPKDLQDYSLKRLALGDKAKEHFDQYQLSIKEVMIKEPDYITQCLKNPLYGSKNVDPLIHFPPEGAWGDPQMPGCLFDYMVTRVAPYGISGVLWYQGESNALSGEALRYKGLFNRLVTSWRQAWQDEALPFCTCQLATFDPSRWGNGFDWPGLRAQQALCSQEISRVYMAVLCDLGDKNNIHPLQKKPVAKRLHDLALEHVYGLEVDGKTPVLDCCCISKGMVQLVFSTNITLHRGDLPAIVVKGRHYPLAVHEARGNTLLLTPPGLTRLAPQVQLSYGQAAWFVPSIFSAKGLPLVPFLVTVKRQLSKTK